MSTPIRLERTITREERGARQVQAGQARRRVQLGVQQHAVDDEPHEQRLDHLQSGGQQREQEDRGDRVAVRPQPAQVLAQVLAPFGSARACGSRWRTLFRGIRAAGRFAPSRRSLRSPPARPRRGRCGHWRSCGGAGWRALAAARAPARSRSRCWPCSTTSCTSPIRYASSAPNSSARSRWYMALPHRGALYVTHRGAAERSEATLEGSSWHIRRSEAAITMSPPSTISRCRS